MPEDISAESAMALERCYDELEDEQTELTSEEDSGLRHAAGTDKPHAQTGARH